MGGRHSQAVVALALAGVLLGGVRPAHAAGGSGGGHGAIVIIGTVLTNVVYFPAKVVYAAVGGVTGAVAYVVTGGQSETAQSI